jgi:predicted nucleic acid-binding protein
MKPQNFFDTNVLIYAFSEAGVRTRQAELLLAGGGLISVQVLNEFVSVLRRKQQRSWEEIQLFCRELLVCCPEPAPLTVATHQMAVGICSRSNLSFYDGLIVAAAAENGCSTLWSEDLQDGQMIEGVRIENPFA